MFVLKRLRFSHFFLSVLCFIFLVLLLIKSNVAKQGILDGLFICYSLLIPSLFLFSVLSNFIFLSPVTEFLGRLLDKFSKKIFRLSGEEFTCFLVSLTAGYPVGASLVNELYKTGKTDRETAQKMLSFCVNSGPAFMVIGIGEIMLGNKNCGIRLLFSHLTASVIIAFFSFLGEKRNFAKQTKQNKRRISVSEAFVTAVSNASFSMLVICGFAISFSALGSIMFELLSKDVATVICPFLDVTVGVGKIATISNLPLLSFFLGFSGISVIAQVLCFSKDINPSFLGVLTGRINHGLVAFLICFSTEKLFPRSTPTFSNSVNISFEANSVSKTASFALMLLCVFFLLFLSKKENEKIRGLIR